MYPCPCCGYEIFAEPPGSFQICRICFWEDDVVQLVFPLMAGGANKVSLNVAQTNYCKSGVSEDRSLTKDDKRDPEWRLLDPNRDIFLGWDVQTDHTRWKQASNKFPMPEGSLYYWRPNYWLLDG